MGNRIIASDLTVEQIQNGDGIVIYDPNSKWNGEPIEWQVIGKDQDGTGTLTLQTKNILTGFAYDTKNNGSNSGRNNVGSNDVNSLLDQWLNSDSTNWYSTRHNNQAPSSSTVAYWDDGMSSAAAKGFLTNLSPEFKEKLKTVTKNVVPCVSGDASSITGKMFSLSVREVDPNYTNSYYSQESGAFTYQRYQVAGHLIKSGINGSWWLRSPNSSSWCNNVWGVRSDGIISSNGASYGTIGPAPACVVPSSLQLEEDVNGKYKIVFSSAPVITTPSTNLGNKIAGFSFDYSITDADADAVTANIKLDGDIVIPDYTVDQTQTYTCTLSNSSFNNLTIGTHAYTITAIDSENNTTTENIIFSKVSKEERYVSKENLVPIMNKIEIKLENRYTKDEVDDLLENIGGLRPSVDIATETLIFS